MATYTTIRWKYDENSKGEAPVKIRIVSQGKQRYLHLGFKVEERDWNKTKGIVKSSHPNYRILNKAIADKMQQVQSLSLDNQDSGKIVTEIRGAKENFFTMAYDFIEQFHNMEQYNTFRGYETKLHKIKNYSGDHLKLSDITPEWLRGYETHLKNTGNKENTIYSDLKCIRAILNCAVREDRLPSAMYPFRKYRLKQSRAGKMGLNRDELQALRIADLTGSKAEARDIFLLCFNLRGTRISDVLMLSKTNISGDRIIFRMAKTGKDMSIRMTEEAREIVNRYTKDGRLFSFVKEGESPIKQRISNATSSVNNCLKDIQNYLGLSKKLTTHIARHTWTQLAKERGIPSAHIQNSLGHSSLSTTEVYLRDLDNSALDEVNDLVTGS